MNKLAGISFETVKLPGFRVWGHESPHWAGRFGIVVQNGRGAVELWSAPSPPETQRIFGDSSMGGVEIHSPTQMYDFAPEPDFEDCHVLRGKCWCDGSSLAYREKFLPLIERGQSVAILHALAAWHDSTFNRAGEYA